MTNSREHPLDDLRRHPPTETMVSIPEIVRVEADIENRHYAPIETALRNEASGYDWKRETGDIETYQHNQTGGWLHIDPQSQFYDRQVQPTTREAALEHAGHIPAHSVGDNTQMQSHNSTNNNDQGISL